MGPEPMITRYPGQKGGLSVHDWFGRRYSLALEWRTDSQLLWGPRIVETAYLTNLLGLTAIFAWVITWLTR